MGNREKYQDTINKLEQWLSEGGLDQELRQELLSYASRLEKDPEDTAALEELYDCFYKELEFGTAGLRGVLGAGTNRMNIYTVGKATKGLAAYVNKHYGEKAEQYAGRKPSVAIAYDSRIKSQVFAEKAAKILTMHNIDVYLYSELVPTPMLSFAVRYFGCCAGIMITASHNPGKYNGYKAYGKEGSQLANDAADEVYGFMKEAEMFDQDLRNLEKAEADQGTLRIIEENSQCVNAYFAAVRKQSSGVPCGDLHVVFTPLNGTGNKPVRRILAEIGVEKVTLVKEQELPDGNFPTCPYPNPEKKEALSLGLALCRELKEPADLLLATDPDCDRVGIAVYSKAGDGSEEYTLISGNEAGILMLDYICQSRKLPEKPLSVKTIVTSKMAARVAAHYGVEMTDVLTGFKYIGEQINMLEEKGEEDRFVFGFEESYGYLAGSHVRDKDAVVASLVICEMAAHYKAQGKTLVDRLQELYREYGYYRNEVMEYSFEGAAGMAEMASIIDGFRVKPPTVIAGKGAMEIADYLKSVRITCGEPVCGEGKKPTVFPESVSETENKKASASALKTEAASGDAQNTQSSKTDHNCHQEKRNSCIRTSEIPLPKSDVLEYVLDDGSSIIVRPSGTEPKLKIYLSAKGATEEEAAAVTEALKSDMSRRISEN